MLRYSALKVQCQTFFYFLLNLAYLLEIDFGLGGEEILQVFINTVID